MLKVSPLKLHVERDTFTAIVHRIISLKTSTMPVWFWIGMLDLLHIAFSGSFHIILLLNFVLLLVAKLLWRNISKTA